MPPKKPVKPNGFYMFALEFKNQHGRKYNSMKDACDAAAPFWSRMSRDQKRPYDERAKQEKSRYAPSRYTSEGLDVEELTRQEQLQLQAEERMREDIRNTITLANMRGADALSNEIFFVIHCNIFCYYQQRDQYYPAEIAVLAFTLKDGVKQENIFHYFVKPGPLPVGYKFEAKQHSDETHQIKVPFDDNRDNNMEEIFFNLKAFLEKKKSPGTKRMPVLYAEKKCRKMIQQILNLWCSEYNDDESLFRVYDLQVMFHTLRNTVAGEPVWPTVTFSDRELEKDVYAYVTEIACEFHSATGKPLYCSQSVVLRYAFVICDNCCGDLKIDLIPGQHIPLRSTVPDGLGRGSSIGTFTSSSSTSSQYGGRSRAEFDSDLDNETASDTWDTESLISNSSSTITTINLEDNFPSLGKSRSQSQNSNFSNFSPTNSSSVRSYAGATVKPSLPSAFEKSMENMSLGPSSNAPKGRGFRRRVNVSDSDASSLAGDDKEKSFAGTSDVDFPPMGKGRGFVPKNLKKPGTEN